MRQVYPKVVCAKSCNGEKMMMLSCHVLSIGLQLTDDTEIPIRAKKHELTNDMMKRAGKVVRYSKSKPDDFLRAKYEHI